VYFDDLVSALKEKILTKSEVANLKIELCRKHGVVKIPKDVEVLLYVKEEDIPIVQKRLKTKPVRSISGVAPVAIMTEPRKCPHGKCAYCPGGPESAFGDVPQSYTGNEPATMRAIRNEYDPYLQVINRLEHYVLCGHVPDKVELIIMGGTFPSYEVEYRERFVSQALQAMNDFGDMFYSNGNLLIDAFKDFFELPAEVGDKDRGVHLIKKMKALKKKVDIKKAQKDNENSFIKCVGMTIETRPDDDILEQSEKMLMLGATRVELGVQSVYDNALLASERGHTVADSVNAIRVLKDVGFKINAHIMPGLPGISYEQDVAMFKQLFDDSDYRPDMLKIYPCMVLKGTKLYDEYKKGDFIPMTTAQATKLLLEAKPNIPPYVRIMRVQRDIPTPQIEAGVDMTNLRQYVHQKGVVCNCIRCREIGNNEIKNPTLNVLEYDASCGKEFFISFDNFDGKLIGYCRLRLPSQVLRSEITSDSAIVRELHVYGTAVGIGKKNSDSGQHKGFGKRLLEKAEEIAHEKGKDKIIIISGIGVRNYYRKLGYELVGPYMVKKI